MRIGRCDKYETSGELYCTYDFLPSQDLLIVVEESLRGALRRRNDPDQGNNDDEMVSRVVDSWRKALSSRSLLLPDFVTNNVQISGYFLASAVLALITIPMGLLWPAVLHFEKELRQTGHPVHIEMLVVVGIWFLGPLLTFGAWGFARRATDMAKSGPDGIVTSVGEIILLWYVIVAVVRSVWSVAMLVTILAEVYNGRRKFRKTGQNARSEVVHREVAPESGVADTLDHGAPEQPVALVGSPSRHEGELPQPATEGTADEVGVPDRPY
jgi:hypothetical protein